MNNTAWDGDWQSRSIEADRMLNEAMLFVAAMVLVAGCGLLACLVPAWRAARVDPASLLRTE